MQTTNEILRRLLEAKGFYRCSLEERVQLHEEAMRRLSEVPRFNDKAAFDALARARGYDSWEEVA